MWWGRGIGSVGPGWNSVADRKHDNGDRGRGKRSDKARKGVIKGERFCTKRGVDARGKKGAGPPR